MLIPVLIVSITFGMFTAVKMDDCDASNKPSNNRKSACAGTKTVPFGRLLDEYAARVAKIDRMFVETADVDASGKCLDSDCLSFPDYMSDGWKIPSEKNSIHMVDVTADAPKESRLAFFQFEVGKQPVSTVFAFDEMTFRGCQTLDVPRTPPQHARCTAPFKLTAGFGSVHVEHYVRRAACEDTATTIRVVSDTVEQWRSDTPVVDKDHQRLIGKYMLEHVSQVVIPLPRSRDAFLVGVAERVSELMTAECGTPDDDDDGASPLSDTCELPGGSIKWEFLLATPFGGVKASAASVSPGVETADSVGFARNADGSFDMRYAFIVERLEFVMEVTVLKRGDDGVMTPQRRERIEAFMGSFRVLFGSTQYSGTTRPPAYQVRFSTQYFGEGIGFPISLKPGYGLPDQAVLDLIENEAITCFDESIRKIGRKLLRKYVPKDATIV